MGSLTQGRGGDFRDQGAKEICSQVAEQGRSRSFFRCRYSLIKLWDGWCLVL